MRRAFEVGLFSLSLIAGLIVAWEVRASTPMQHKDLGAVGENAAKPRSQEVLEDFYNYPGIMLTRATALYMPTTVVVSSMRANEDDSRAVFKRYCNEFPSHNVILFCGRAFGCLPDGRRAIKEEWFGDTAFSEFVQKGLEGLYHWYEGNLIMPDVRVHSYGVGAYPALRFRRNAPEKYKNWYVFHQATERNDPIE